MIKTNGKIEKKIYCTNCFSIITWDGAKDEYGSGECKTISCPRCKKEQNIVNNNLIQYIEKDIIENPKAYIDGVAYATTAEAIENLKDRATLMLTEDITLTNLNINNANINLNGHTITVAQTIRTTGIVSLSNGSINTTGNVNSIEIGAKSAALLNNMSITSKQCGVVSSGYVKLNNSEINAQEAAILAIDGGKVEINGGTYSTIDNGVIMTNGSAGRGKNSIKINGGVFTGHITSAGYLAFVAYLANDDELIVNGGTFTVDKGSAFVVRGGKLTIKPNAIISVSEGATGKVGDGNQIIPAGYDVVVDYKSKYPAVDSIEVNAPARTVHIIE